MMLKNIDIPYIIIDVLEHNDLKPKLLNLIDQIPESSTVKEGQQKSKISKTDWYLPKEFKRDYLNLFYKHIEKYMNLLTKEMCVKKWSILNGWFQQYKTSDYHTWHNHTSVNYAGVYYLELPYSSEKTEIFNVSNKKLIEIDNIKEGNILIFPAGMPHRSKPIYINQRKTVIAFNLNFVDVDNKKIDSFLNEK